MGHDQDHVDRILEEWAAEWPGLDVSPQGLVGRISRLSRFLERGLVDTFETFRLNGGEFDVLATLRRRAGREEAVTPTSLADALMLSSAAMTNRIDRLVEAGLVTRERDDADRRAVFVRLSDTGRQLIDRALVEHLKTEAEMINVLTPAEQKTLARLLRKLLVPIENGQPPVGVKQAK
ncbi:MAG TPA: MarR family transcriptional regulator [Kribbella sp.]